MPRPDPTSKSLARLLVFLAVALATLLLAGCGEDRPGPAPAPARRPVFRFETGDRVALVGNALAERMQHSGRMESLLQHALPEHGLSFRNLGFSGDEVTVRQRTAGFGSMEDWLDRCRASVVFLFYGFNESFAGEQGVAAFADDLARLVRRIGGRDCGAGAPPRIVLFTPTPTEDMGDPHLPDAAAANLRLAPYADAIRLVAEQEGVFLVDLFEDLADDFADAEAMTIDGVHLNETGHEALARAVLAAFELEVAAAPEALAATRAEVLRKNELWFQRHRATDGYNVYGGRSSLRYVDDVSNFDVLQREMQHLDELARRHDDRIRSLAAGAPRPLDLAGLPALIPVATNIPGENPDGSHVFRGGEEAIAAMTPGPGLEIALFASEERFPELANPVQMSFDARGRLWVAVWPTYPHWRPDRPMNDKLLILEDEDGDGRADSCTTFADGLHNPTGFEFWQGGVFVAQAPDLLFLEDEDGDDVADRRTRVLHGLSSADTHHSANSFVIGPDGALYFQEGTFHQSQIESIRGPIRSRNACVWRYEPRTRLVERYVAYDFANPHGHVFDRWGQDFVTDGTGNQNYYALPFSGRLPEPEKHRGYGTFFAQRCRPAAGTEILSSALFGPDYEGDYLIANVIGFRGILRYEIRDEGSGFAATEVDPIVASADESFRPVDIEVGPDGALYFLDWQNPIIGHMQHHLRDPNRDDRHGRVYRVTPKAKKAAPAPPLAGRPVAELIELLRSPEDRLRYRVRAELSARPEAEVLAAARARAASADDEHFLLELLWLHQQFGTIDEDLLHRGLEAREPRARAAAVRVLRGMRHRVADPLALVERAARDEHPRVRLEAVVAASFFDSAEAAGAALAAVERPLDRFLSYALKETLTALEPRWRAAIRAGDLVAATPEAQAYLLEQVAPAELARLPRVPAVWRTELGQAGVGREARRDAVAGLAADSGRHPALVLIDAVAELDASASAHKAHVLGELGVLLQERLADPPADLERRLADLADRAHTPEARGLAMAARAVLAGSLDQALAAARESTAALGDFLAMIPMLADPTLRASVFAEVRPLALDPRAFPSLRGEPLAPGLRALWFDEVPTTAAPAGMAGLVAREERRVERIALPADLAARSDAFAMRFEGQLRVPENGRWIFSLLSDDGSMLLIDGALVVDNDGAHSALERSGEIELAAGLHDILVTYYDQGGGQALRASWQGPGGAKEEIPAAALLTAADRRISAAALRALATMPGHADEKLADAARLLAEDRLVGEALALVASVPEKERPAERAGALVAGIVAMAATLPAEARSEPEALAAVELARSLADLLPAAEATAARRRLDELYGTVIVLKTLPHRMLYDRKEIFVTAGRPVAIVFQNNDAMPHNLVIAAGGTLEAVGGAAERLGPDSPGTRAEYVPDLPEVRHATALLKPGETTRLVFTAPESPCDLDFLCTFPGHWRVMNGVIRVVADMTGRRNLVIADEGTGERATRKFVRDWTVADLADDFDGPWRTNRTPRRGERLFGELGCVQCHRHGDLGDPRNIDLTKIGAKYRGAELLAQVIEPSRSILEGYQNTILDLADQPLLIGRVIREDAGLMCVNPTIQDPDEIVEVKIADVVERRTSKISPMPTGLLVTLDREEILDLVDFLESPTR